jgi:hypothetical protein
MGIEENRARILPVKFTPIDLNLLPRRLRAGMVTPLDLAHARRPQREFDRLVRELQEPLPILLRKKSNI